MTVVWVLTTEFLQTGSIYKILCLKGIRALLSVQNNSFVHDNLYLCCIRCNWWECHWV